VVAIFSILPAFFSLGALTKALIFSIFAMGYNIIFGNTGYMSFGHAAFFGLGAYGTGIIMIGCGVSIWIGILGGILVAIFAGLIVGYFSLKRGGVYYGMLTLAFSQLFYYIVFHGGALTGGDNGLVGIPEPVVNFPIRIRLGSPWSFYGFVLIMFLITVFLIRRITSSPFGKILFAIRENENRASACGFNVKVIKFMAFLFSALFAGLAGSLYALFLGYVPINSLSWVTSGKVIIMTIFGGAGTFWGPTVGACIYVLLEETISSYIGRWEIVVGLIALFIIIFLPLGIVGTLKARGVGERTFPLIRRWLGRK